MDFLKEINPQLVITQIICFFLILGLLRWKLWGPVFKALEDRREKISAEMKAIDDVKADVAKIKAEYTAHLNRIDQEAQERLSAVERQGEENARQIREKARQEADHIIEEARKEIHFELVKVRADLKGDVVEMVIKVTEQMIQEKLTFDDDRKIIEGMLEKLEKIDER